MVIWATPEQPTYRLTVLTSQAAETRSIIGEQVVQRTGLANNGGGLHHCRRRVVARDDDHRRVTQIGAAGDLLENSFSSQSRQVQIEYDDVWNRLVQGTQGGRTTRPSPHGRSNPENRSAFRYMSASDLSSSTTRTQRRLIAMRADPLQPVVQRGIDCRP